MTDLEAFLAQHVEAYLFDDLRTMISASAQTGKNSGALGNPLLASCFAGIELFGALLSQTAFNTHAGHVYFGAFWSNHLYVGSPARAAAGAEIYQLMRHGLAHVAVSKGRFCILKGDPAMHLTHDAAQDIIYLDAAQLATDLMQTYDTALKVHLGSGTSRLTEIELRHQEMVKAFGAQATARFPNIKFPAVPSATPGGTMSPSGMHQPSGQIVMIQSPSTSSYTVKKTP